ncbi:MAG: hypothetical protein ACTSQ4_03755 [Candidatus Heimdallarchaeaceae archaeon]
MSSNEKTPFRFLLITYQTKQPLLLVLLPFLIISNIVGWIYKHYEIITLDLSFFVGGEGDVSFQIIDGIIFVSIAVISSVVIVLTLKYGLERFLKIFFSVCLFLSPISIMWLHGYLIDFYLQSGQYWFEISFALVGLITGILTLLVFVFDKGNKHSRNSLVVFLGIILGSIFGLLLSLATFLTLIILISIFDIYSVFKGPISKMFQKANMPYEQISNPLIKKETAIGIGDFIFYSSLVTFTATNFGLAIGFASIVGLLLGVVFTEQLLMRFGRFPGLPLPIFLSLAFLGFGWLVSNYLLNSII